MATASEFPPERERNIKRKQGFQYHLITVAIQKGKKFGLNMQDTDNRVIVTEVENDSMCASLLEKFDRICDVDGIPVTDKELTKKQIIKGLKENRKVSLAVERPANKERLDQVQRLLAMIETKPPSIVLEADVKEILNRYNSKLQSNKGVKQRSALSKSSKKSKHKVCLDDKQINMVHIGMDNEHLQEDLEKVPKKTYETSLARLKEQSQGAAP